jgi:hypothetical protein
MLDQITVLRTASSLLPFPTMVRTKANARVSTGGTAPQIDLHSASAPLERLPLDPAVAQPNRPSSQEDNNNDDVSLLWSPCSKTDPIINQYCYKCINGGFLLLCDFCPRSLCNVCIKGPKIPASPKVKFMCIACFLYVFKGSQPYYVSRHC